MTVEQRERKHSSALSRLTRQQQVHTCAIPKVLLDNNSNSNFACKLGGANEYNYKATVFKNDNKLTFML